MGGGVIQYRKRESISPDVFLKAFFYSLHCLFSFSQSISGWVVGGTCNAPEHLKYGLLRRCGGNNHSLQPFGVSIHQFFPVKGHKKQHKCETRV